MRLPSNLDLAPVTSQTRTMAHSYIKLDFGTDEEKAQQARHKLDGWKQAFRLDKRLLYKLDRPEGAAGEAGSKPEPIEKPARSERRSRRAKNSTAENGHFAGTRGCSTTLPVRRAPPAKMVRSPSLSRSQ